MHQVLEGKEERVRRQREWMAVHSLPLISFTINMLGEVKQNKIAKIAFGSGHQAIIEKCKEHQINISGVGIKIAVTGYELIFAIDVNSAQQLKQLMVEVEEDHPFGRLFDIDVIDLDGSQISRQQLNQPPRRCLICEQQAKTCARNRTHSLTEMINKMSEIINERD
ncbi:citrate lyase holo-[acyl-carrier protein] synthase [Vibrio kyushuensis]|uniref:citrate lyase holo-[acyl-carrier protein] synthase n=1 Tax=Vibrio kyushuensis TaxID=2910249 RepID=UPI003D0E43D2